MSATLQPRTSPMTALTLAARPLAFSTDRVPAHPVLLVDGDPDARIIMRRLLEHHGYETLEAMDRDAALSIARERDISLIVSEMYVSCGDGMTCLVESIRSDDELSDIPVLIVTTQAFRNAEQRALRAGSAGYIVKPFAAMDVLAEIARLVEPPPNGG